MGANLITTIITAISILAIVLGIVFGLIRGFKRSLIMLMLTAITFLIAWILCDAIAEAVLGIHIEEGVSLVDSLKATLSEQGLPFSVVRLVVNAIIIMLEIVVFVSIFSVLSFIMWILFFPIIKLIMFGSKNKEEQEPKTVGDIIGGIALSLVSSIIFAYTVCAPLTGLAGEVAKISKINLNGEQVLPLERTYDVNEYLGTFFGKIYTSTGGLLYNHVAITVDIESGDQVYLSDNVDAVVAASDLLTEAQKIISADYSEGLNEDNVSVLVESLTKMEETKSALSESSVEIFNEVLIDLSATLGEDLPISVPEDFDFSQVNFQEAAEAIEVVYDYSQSDEESLTDEQVDVIVTAFADNMIIVESIQGQTLVQLDKASQDIVNEKLETIDKLTEEQVALLKGLLGME